MARRRRKTSAARVVAGLPVIQRYNDVLESVYEADPDGRPVVHHRTVDTLGIMLRVGTITKDMHDAARDFQAQFTVSRFDVVRCMPLVRLPGSGGPGDLTDAQFDARRHVGKALDALGGLGSPAGSCVWHVVGLCSARSASGRCGRAGVTGLSGWNRRKGSWWRRWGCWRGGMVMGKVDGEQWVADATSHSRRLGLYVILSAVEGWTGHGGAACGAPDPSRKLAYLGQQSAGLRDRVHTH